YCPPPHHTPTLFPYTTLFRSPSDEDRNLSDSGRAEGLQRVPQERLAGHRQKGLRKIRREGPHPRALSGCEDDGLHAAAGKPFLRSEEHTSELQSRFDLVCRLL